MCFVFDDGGRAAAGFKGFTGDCACRAISIATQRPYKEIYDLINEFGKAERPGKRRKGNSYNGHRSSARTGVYKDTMQKIMASLGWRWVPTMKIGQGCTVHVSADELPAGRLILNVSHHYIAFIDGVVHDTYDSTYNGKRCVYGYWVKA